MVAFEQSTWWVDVALLVMVIGYASHELLDILRWTHADYGTHCTYAGALCRCRAYCMVLCGLAVSTVWPVARVPLLTLPPSVTVSFSVLHCCSGTGWRRWRKAVE